MTFQDEKQIYKLWVKAWDEDVSILEEITDPDCVVHQARMDGKSSEDQKGAEALKRIINEGCAYFDDVKMTVEVEPIVEEHYVSARWQFSGTFNGGMPGATAKKGTKVRFNGIDIMLITEGKIKDYWVSSDVVDLMVQLGMF